MSNTNNISIRIRQNRINYLSALNAALMDEISHLRGEKRVYERPDPKEFAELLDNMAAEDEANGIYDHLEDDGTDEEDENL